jgi:hypothetical protein
MDKRYKRIAKSQSKFSFNQIVIFKMLQSINATLYANNINVKVLFTVFNQPRELRMKKTSSK